MYEEVLTWIVPVKRAHTTGAPGYADSDAEVYSDHSDSGKGGIIDIDAVSGQGESAPTSLHRDRKLGENVRGKGKAKAEGEEGQVKQSRSGRDVEKKVRKPRVKDEPLSPLNRDKDLEGLNGGVPPPVGREDDEMMSGDEEQDLDHEGRSVRAFARTGGNDEEGEEVNEAQKVDLSESESEEEEEGMEGDFVQSDGHVRLVLSRCLPQWRHADGNRLIPTINSSCSNFQRFSRNSYHPAQSMLVKMITSRM